jgi:hypothetical protein
MGKLTNWVKKFEEEFAPKSASPDGLTRIKDLNNSG